MMRPYGITSFERVCGQTLISLDDIYTACEPRFKNHRFSRIANLGSNAQNT